MSRFSIHTFFPVWTEDRGIKMLREHFEISGEIIPVNRTISIRSHTEYHDPTLSRIDRSLPFWNDKFNYMLHKQKGWWQSSSPRPRNKHPDTLPELPVTLSTDPDTSSKPSLPPMSPNTATVPCSRIRLSKRGSAWVYDVTITPNLRHIVIMRFRKACIIIFSQGSSSWSYHKKTLYWNKSCKFFFLISIFFLFILFSTRRRGNYTFEVFTLEKSAVPDTVNPLEVIYKSARSPIPMISTSPPRRNNESDLEDSLSYLTMRSWKERDLRTYLSNRKKKKNKNVQFQDCKEDEDKSRENKWEWTAIRKYFCGIRKIS